MKVIELIELLMELPEDLDVLVKHTREEKLVPVAGVLDAERTSDGHRAAVMRFEDDWTEYWWRGISTPHEAWGMHRPPPEREPHRLTSLMTTRARLLAAPVQE